MEKLKNQQKAYKGHFTTCVQSLDNACNREVLDYDEIKKYMKSLKDKFEKIERKSNEIQEFIADEGHLQKEIDDVENCTTFMLKCIQKQNF